MTVKRPTKPASVATPEEVNRVAVMSGRELAEAAPYSIIDPISIPEIKIWLRVDQATDTGTLTIPDAKGGSSAVQATGANKPTVGTTSNGLAKLTNAAGTGLTLPVSAGNTNAAYFAIAFWCRPSDVATNSADFYNMDTGAGTSQHRLSVRQDTNDLKVFIYEPPGSNNINRTAVTTRAILLLNVWKFIMYEFNGSLSTEALRSVFKDMGMPITTPQVQTFAGAAAAMPTTLEPGVTGNSILFNRTTGFTNGFRGDIGPDIFFYDPRTMTDQNRVRMAQFRVPVG